MALRAGFHGTVGQPSAQVIDGSLKFDDGSSQYLNRTPSVVGNRKTWTFSCWVKRSEIGSIYPALLSAGSASGDTGFFQITFESDEFSTFMRHGSGTNYYYTNAKLREISSWYHLVVAMDTTQSAPADRLKMYVNGVEQTFRNSSVPAENQTFLVNNTSLHQIGATKNSSGTTNLFLPGHLSNVYLIDGQQLGPENFGFTDPLTNTWRPKKYTGDFNFFPDIGMAGDSGQAIEIVINRQVDKAWIKKYGSSTYEGGGDPSDPSSAPSFHLPSGGSLYWFTTAYDTAHTFVLGSSSETGTQPEWASGGTTGSLTRDSATTVSGTPSSSYSSARTDALADNTVYAFTFTITTGAGGAHTGWFLSTSSSYSSGTPDEQTSGNTVGARFGGGGTGYYNYVKVYGTFATLNPNTNGQLSKRGANSFYLPMDGNSPIGQDRSGIVIPNNGSTWSNSLTSSSGFRSSEPKTNAFDGNTSSICSAVGSGTITFTSPVTFASNSTIRVFLHGGDHTVTVNGGSNQTISAGSFQTVTYSNSGNATFTMTFHRGGGADTGVRAIEINGVILIDGQIGNSWTPVNLGGSNSVDKATGALPILEGPGGAVANVATRTDAYANNLVLALPLVGTANDVHHHIKGSGSAKTITVNGNPTASTTQSNFYGGSFDFDESGDYLSVPSTSDMTFGTGDFTIEGWFYYDATSTPNNGLYQIAGSHLVSNSNTLSCNFETSGGRTQQLYFGSAGGWRQNGTDYEFPFQKWNHVAQVRSSGVIKIYINGKLSQSWDDTTDYTFTHCVVGGYYSSSYLWDGYIQDFRVYKGAAKYTSNFIPASTNPDILSDTPSGVSGSSKLAKITDGAVGGFETASDYLSLAASSDFEFDGDHTIELFVYHNTISGDGGSVPYSTGGSGQPDQIFIGSDGIISYAYSQTGAISSPAGTAVIKKWQHIAVSKSGTNLRMFVDGKIVASSSNHSSTIGSSSNGPRIGARRDGYHPIKGFISNLRVVKGSALYTSDFIPPTAPLTNVTNTKLLCCQSVAEQQNNFIRMFKSSTLYTTKADILANATEIGDGATLSNEYWYIIPTGDEPIGSDVFTNDGSITTPHGSNHFALYWRNGSSWTQTIGTYGPSEYSDFDYKSDDSSSTYSVYPSRDFYVFGSDASPSEPKLISGTLPTRAKYYSITGAVKPGTIAVNGNVAATNFNPFNTDTNTVRGQETGYPTWNPLRVSGQTLSNNNMTTTGASGNVLGSMFTPTSGKFYWEVTAGSDYTMTGIQRENNYDMSYPGNSAGQIAMYLNTGVGSGQLYEGGSITSSWGGGVTGDVIGVALDMDNNKVYFYNNGRGLGSGGITGTPTAVDVPTGGGYTANCRSGSGAYDGPSTINFGQKPFKFPPPDGFQPLNDANVRPETVIARPDQYVAATTYSGNGTSKTITGLKHKPDFLWIKNRADSSAAAHRLFDSVRGANKTIFSNLTNDELEVANSLNSFNSDGFSVGSGNWVNGDGDGIVAWSWKAGGDKNTFNVDDVGYQYYLQSPTGTSTPVYSGYCSGTQYSSTYSYAKAFDNSTSTVSFASNGNTITFTPPGGIANSGNILVTFDNGSVTDGGGSADFQINGSSVKSFFQTAITADGGGSGSSRVATITGITNITSMSWSRIADNDLFGVRKIVINGSETLTDGATTAPTGASVGTKQGFSIIKYTGPNDTNNHEVPHGLSQAPDFILTKNLDTSYNWDIYHSSLANDKYLIFTQAAPRNQGFSGRPTSTVFKTEHDYSTNENQEYIAYCWHDVPGLQKFGSYGGADAFVELGFRPAVLIIKSESSSRNWIIIDSARDTFNPSDRALLVNDSAQEDDNSVYAIDFLSNGFKIRGSNGQIDGDSSYIYAAWAEAPSVNLYGGGANAR